MASKTRKIDGSSDSAVLSGFSLFTQLPTNVAIEKSHYREIQTLNPVTDVGPYTFRLFSDINWVQLSKIFIQTIMQIQVRVNNIWRPIAAADNAVAPIQLIGKTLFKQLKIKFNGTEVYDSGSLYAYRAYLETLLMYSDATKEQYFGAAGWHRQDENAENAADAGFIARAEPFAGGEYVMTWGNLHFDLANQERYLLNGMDLVFELSRNSNEFLLQTYAPAGVAAPALLPCRLHIQSMRMYVKVIDAFNNVNNGVQTALTQTPALYPKIRTEIKSIFLNTGRRETPENNIFTDVIPRRIICALVAGPGYDGSNTNEPFNFRPFNLSQVEIMAGGQTYPAVPYNLDFGANSNRFLRAFFDMYDAIGYAQDDRSNGISVAKFKAGWTIFAFDLTPGMVDGSTHSYELLRQGTTSINMRFRDPIPALGVELIIYAEFDSVTSIDLNRNVTNDGK
jgi:hypothetical protein